MKPLLLLLRWSEQQQYDENNGDRLCGPVLVLPTSLLACLPLHRRRHCSLSLHGQNANRVETMSPSLCVLLLLAAWRG